MQEEAMPTALVFVRKGFRVDFNMLEYHIPPILDGFEIYIKIQVLIRSITTAVGSAHGKTVADWKPLPEYSTNGFPIVSVKRKRKRKRSEGS